MVPRPEDISPSGISYAEILRMATRWSGAVRITDVPSTDIGWLWPGRIPLGHVTLLVSDPGAGKSLVTLDVAARVSTGAQWPDQCSRHTPCAVTESLNSPSRHALMSSTNDAGQLSADAADGTPTRHPAEPAAGCPVPATRAPSSVVLLTMEDHIADTVRPRLEALGADCSRMLALSHVPGDDFYDTPRPFALNRDLNRLASLIRALRDCRLVILDPITAFLGDTSDQCNTDVWKLLSLLTKLAEEWKFAVLVVSHLRKKEGAAIHRAMGSLAFVACARTAWTIANYPADANKRLLLPIKNNLAPDAKGLAFTIESTDCAPIVHLLPETIEARADAVLASNRQRGRPDDERQLAIKWLRQYIAKRPLPSRAVRQAAEANGISSATLRRAFRDLGLVAFQPKNVLHGPWMWTLPGSDAQKSGGEFCATDQFTDEFANFVSN